MNPWMARGPGCFGWFFLSVFCSWPFIELGVPDKFAFIGGVVLATIFVGVLGNWARRERIDEMKEANR